MKICFVSPYSPRSINGIGTFLINLSKQLQKNGHSFLLLTKHVPNEFVMDDVFNCDNFIEVTPIDKKYLSNIHFTLSILKHIFKNRSNIDILHLQQPHMICAFSAIFGRLLRIPVITTIHLKSPPSKNRMKHTINKFLERITLDLSNLVTFVSEDTKKTFEYNFGVVIKNGVDVDYFNRNVNRRTEMRQKLGLNDDLILIFASRWTKNKGIYELLNALSKIQSLTDCSVKLLLLGSGDSTGETPKVMEQIEKLKIEHNVKVVGAVDSKYLRDYFCASDVFVLPSYLEGLPMVLLEVMSCGLTPIVSKVGGNAELVKNGKNGFLISPHNVNDLTQTILWCINNKDKLQNIGNNAAETVRSNFSIEKMTEEYINEYNKL